MDLHLWLGFLAASFLLAIIPGPGVASIVGFAFSSGRRVALASVAGMAVGNTIAITVSLAGAGAILATSATAFTVLKWAGAAYLIAIGILALIRSDRRAGTDDDATPIGARIAFLTNVLVGTFHPKTILFFVAFATQFVDPARPYWPQAAIMVATFPLVAAATDTLYALAASRTAGFIRRPAVRRWTRRAGGCVLIAAGIVTAARR